MNEKAKNILSNAMSAIGIIFLSVSPVESLFFGGCDKWVGAQFSITGVALIMVSCLLRIWKQDMNPIDKTITNLAASSQAAAVIITIKSSDDIGYGVGIMLLGVAIYMFLFYEIL